MAGETMKGLSTSSTSAPVIIDVGKKSRKAIKQLRKGEGKLMEEVNQCLRELREANKISASAQPVIVVVQKKPQTLMEMMNW